MLNKSDAKSAAAYAGELFITQRYHCAEAIVAAYCRAAGIEDNQLIALATPFGGGFGKSFKEACGVLSGGLLTIGHCHGRSGPAECWDIPAELGARYREIFIDANQTTVCGDLRERFGEEQMEQCRRMVEHGTESLVSLLCEQQDTHKIRR